MSRTAIRGRVVWLLLVSLGITGGLAACEGEPDLTLPSPEELEGVYGPAVDVELKGNVVDVHVIQPADQLRRGGAVWAKVGPYIYLFTPQTQQLFDSYPGLGGVQVTTMDGRERLIARAMLESRTLNGVTWRKAIGLAGRARMEGTQRPSYILDLIQYGEDLVEHEYSSRYVKDQR